MWSHLLGARMLNVWQILKDRIQGKALKGQRRSSKWRKIRAAHIKKNPRCNCCGLKTKVEVHHIIPFSIAPDLELNPENLMTLCENKKWGINCHLLVGHLGNYRRINAAVAVDAISWRMKLGYYPKDD